jgi:phage shock protein E
MAVAPGPAKGQKRVAGEVKRKMPDYLWVLLILAAVLAAKHLLSGKAPARVVEEKLRQGALVVDVRTPAEFAAGHYEEARNIPLNELSSRMDELGKTSDQVIVYCLSGTRAGAAARMMKRAGYTNVVNAGSLRAMKRVGAGASTRANR